MSGRGATHPAARSMQPELAVHGADFRRLDQAHVRHRHRVQRALKLLQPEIEKFVQLREVWAKVVVLPDVSLKKPGVIGPTIEDVGGRQSVAFELPAKVLRIHIVPPSHHGECSETRSSITSRNIE